MAEFPLSQTVDASASKTSWRSSLLSLLTSTLLQSLTVIALIVTPLMATQTMPAPVSALQLPDFVPVQVAPPVQRGTPQGTKRTTDRRTDRPPPPSDVHFVPVGEPPEGWDDDVPPAGEPDGCIDCLPPGWGDLPTHPARPAQRESPAEPIRISGDVRPPRKVVHVNPVYPRIALNAQIHGVVRLQAVIDAEGRVVDLSVVESVKLLDQAAVDAVRQWRYEPTVLNGRPVPVIMTVSVEFKLR